MNRARPRVFTHSETNGSTPSVHLSARLFSLLFSRPFGGRHPPAALRYMGGVMGGEGEQPPIAFSAEERGVPQGKTDVKKKTSERS